MRRGLDLDKAEAALKRAAEKAMHGTREERSGRFHAVSIERRSERDYAIGPRAEPVRDTKVAGRGKRPK
jgi:hypothetical protein